MSVKNTIRRLTKQLAKQGDINTESEATMMMVSVGDKGYENKWPNRPFHQKNGSMRKKRRLQSHVINGFKETQVAIYSGVFPTHAGPMTISADGMVNVEMNFEYATAVVNNNSDLMQAVVEEKIKALHSDHAPSFVNIPAQWPGSVPTESPLEAFIAVDPGHPDGDKAVSAEYVRDPVTGQLELRQVSIVPPGEGSPLMAADLDQPLIQVKNVPDGERDFVNIWEGNTSPEALIAATAAAYARGTLPPVDFKPEPSHKEDFTSSTEPTNLADKINALSNGATSDREERAARIQAEAEATIGQITQALNMEPYKLATDLPEVGDATKFYYVFEMGMFFHWDGENYMPIQPSSREGGVLVKELFPEEEEQKVQEELADTHQADRRSWGRKLWDLFTGKHRG